MIKILYLILAIIYSILIIAYAGGSILKVRYGFFEIVGFTFLQLAIMVLLRELSYGLVGKKNGLNFNALYLGPFSFIREDNKFKRQKGFKVNCYPFVRAQLDNNEITNDEEFNKHIYTWKKAITAGYICELIICNLFIIIALMLNYYVLIHSTLTVFLYKRMTSTSVYDGKQKNLIKYDEVFKSRLLYLNSVVGNSNTSKKSREYLACRLFNSLENAEIKKGNIVSLSAGLSTLFKAYLVGDISELPHTYREIIECTLKYEGFISRNQIDLVHYKSLIVYAIIHKVIYFEDYEEAMYLYREVKDNYFNLPGEMLDFYRMEHILGIDNKEEELISRKYTNSLYKGCIGIKEIDILINRKIINFVNENTNPYTNFENQSVK